MRNEEQRDEVFEHLKPYLEDEETIEDLRKICKRFECPTQLVRFCRGCPVMELWLSNEYGEWKESYTK